MHSTTIVLMDLQDKKIFKTYQHGIHCLMLLKYKIKQDPVFLDLGRQFLKQSFRIRLTKIFKRLTNSF